MSSFSNRYLSEANWNPVQAVGICAAGFAAMKALPSGETAGRN